MPLRILALGGMLYGLAAWCDEPPPQEQEAAILHATPQAAFESLSVSAKNGDWKAFHGCLTRTSGDELAGELVTFGLVLRRYAPVERAGRIKKHQKQLEDTFARHGVTRTALEALAGEKDATKRQRQMGRLVKDQGVFCQELMQILQTVTAQVERSPFSNARLREVIVTGDRATGTMVVLLGGKERLESLRFDRMDGGWRIHLPRKSDR